MPGIAEPFIVEPFKNYFQFSLTAASGLPAGIVREWQGRGFSALPFALIEHRFPKTEDEAKRACRALIDWLREQETTGLRNN